MQLCIEVQVGAADLRPFVRIELLLSQILAYQDRLLILLIEIQKSPYWFVVYDREEG